MQEIRYAMVDGEKVPVLISDENEALQAAKAARRAIVGLWREDGKENEWCADTLITDVEDADEEFLERIARRHLGLPWTICETERLILREIAERDYEEIVKNHVDDGINGRKVELVNYDDGLDTAEKIAGYTKRHYEVFEFGFWAVEEKKSGNLAGVVGFRIPQDDAAGDVEDWLLSFDDENILDDTLELGYHIFPEYRRQGYAKEACLAAVEYAKEEFGTVQFLARIEKDNIVSKKVAERLGFVRAA